MNRAEELLHRGDATECRLFVRLPCLNAEYIDTELREAGRIMLIHIACPGAPDGGKACAVCDIIKSAELMLEAMAGPVATIRATAGQAVMAEGGGPHDFCARIIVFRIRHQDVCIGHHRAEQALGDRVGQLHGAAIVEVALHRVHADVRCTGHGLILRQSHRELRIHDGEARTCEIRVIGAFDTALVCHLRDDGRVRHLGAGCCDRQYDALRGACARLALEIVEIPDVARGLIRDSVADGLCGVDDGTAADGKDEVDTFLPTELDALVDLAEVRVRYDTAKLDIADPGFLELLFNRRHEARLLHTLTSVVDQNLRRALLLHKLSGFRSRIRTKHHLRRCIINKWQHSISSIFHRRFCTGGHHAM